MQILRFRVGIILAVALGLAAGIGPARGQSGGFYPAAIGANGVLSVDAHNSYYDGSDGLLFQKVALPAGATKLQFRVTGGVITDSSGTLASPDGLFADGRAQYNASNVRYSGTYQGVPLGATTGIDPALFGVFYSDTFTGTPQDSANYRSDSGLIPDPRRLSTYSPALNQPFWIGDGYDANSPFITTSDSYVPGGQNQTFTIPAGAKYLLLGLGADVQMSDNGSPGSSAFQVHVYSDVPSAGAVRFAFATQPGGADAGLPLSPQPVVQALNGDGSVATSYTGPITLSIVPNSGSAGATLGGTATVNAVNGVATFSGLSINKPGANYVLTASGGGLAGANSAPFTVTGTDHSAGFHPSNLGVNGVLTVDSHDTYYDGSDGKLFQKVPLPLGATKLQFRVTGGVITDSSNTLASPDGLYADGRTPYNASSVHFAGTYQGVPVGATTGIDPALFGVFFNDTFTGTPDDSLNYRSDNPTTHDPRVMPEMFPTVNQPFWVGDGYSENNPFLTSSDTYIPNGASQTFDIPAGAKYLLLGLGADVALGDNQNGATTTAFRVHVYDNSATLPAVSIAFSRQPNGGAAGAPLAVAPVVVAKDAQGNVATGYNGAVTVVLLPGSGAGGATLSGPTTVNAVDGIASFPGLIIDKAGVNYVLTATASGLGTAQSLPFHIPGALAFFAAHDFSPATNPNGAWQYGYETTRGAAFIPFTQSTRAADVLDVWSTGTIDSLGVYHNSTDTVQAIGSSTYQPGQLAMHPGPQGQNAVVRWTAPADGVYRLKVRFAGAVNNNGTTTDVAVLENGAEVFSGFVNLNGSPNQTEYVLAKPFKMGDTLDFTVGYGNGNYSSDTTALDLAITTFPDVDGSGAFDLNDVLATLRIAAGLQTSTAPQMSRADFVQGSGLNLADVLFLLKLYHF